MLLIGPPWRSIGMVPVAALAHSHAVTIPTARTLAEIMADSGHYSIDSTTIRAHISAAGGKRGGLIDALLAARGVGSPVSKLLCLADALGRPLAFHHEW